MKTKIFIISILGILSSIIGCASMPIFLALIPCVIWLGLEFWFLFIPLITFVVFIPLWWWCSFIVNELNVKLNEKENKENEK